MFGEAIKKMIHRYQGDLIAINRLNNTCICATAMTGMPSSSCPYCLGTGQKIRIEKVKGVVQESNGPSTMRGVTDCVVTKEIFMDAAYLVRAQDLIIFNQEVYEIYQIKTFRLTQNEPIYHILYATPLKYDSHFILQNLKQSGVLK